MTMRNAISKAAVAIVLAAAALTGPNFGMSVALAQSEPLLKIRINKLPIADYVPAEVALSRGWFKDEGLDVVITTVAPGAIAMQAVIAGKLDVIYSGNDTSLKARGQGLDIMMIANQGKVQLTPPGAAAVLVRKDGGIQSSKDLEGKRVMVNSLQNVDWAYTREGIARAGGNPSKAHFLELDYPLQVDALLGGQGDAAQTVEPFTTIGLQTGKLSVLSWSYVDIQPGLNITGWSSTTSWVKEHPRAIAGFRRALQKAMDLIQQNPQEKREALLKFTSLKPELVDKIRTNDWTTKIDPADLQKQLEIYHRQGMIDKTFDVKTMIAP